MDKDNGIEFELEKYLNQIKQVKDRVNMKIASIEKAGEVIVRKDNIMLNDVVEWADFQKEK